MKRKSNVANSNLKTLEVMTGALRILGESGAIIGRNGGKIVLAISLFPHGLGRDDISDMMFPLSIEKERGMGSMRVFSSIHSDEDFMVFATPDLFENGSLFDGFIPEKDEKEWPYLAEVKELIRGIKPMNTEISNFFDQFDKDISNKMNELLKNHRSEILNFIFSGKESGEENNG